MGAVKPVIVMVISSIGIGSVIALMKKALDVGVNHMVIAAYRMAFSALILAPFAYILEWKTRPEITFRLLVDHFISAFIGASLMQFFSLLGLSYTSATVTCAILGTMPAITFGLALIFRIENLKNLKTKAGILKMIGTAICISGALFLSFYKGHKISNSHIHVKAPQHNKNDHESTKDWLLGCLYVTIATTLLSLWMLFIGKLNIKYPCKYSSTCLMSIFGAFQCALLSLYKTQNIQDWIIHSKFLIAVIIYAGVIGQAMSTVATSWGIQKLGAVCASTFSPVSLVSATIFDFLILHTPLYVGSVGGSVVAVTGLYVFLWGKKKETKASTTLSSQIDMEDKTTNNDNASKSPVKFNNICLVMYFQMIV